MDKQLFGQKLYEASLQCINITGIAHCLTEVNADTKVARMWLGSALYELANSIEHLSDVLCELEEEYHSDVNFKYPIETNANKR